MKKRILYVTVLLMLISAVLFGCGKKSYFQKRDEAQGAGESGVGETGAGADEEGAGQLAADDEADTEV